MEEKSYSVAVLLNNPHKSARKFVEVGSQNGVNVDIISHDAIVLTDFENNQWYQKILEYDVIYIRSDLRNAVGQRLIKNLQTANKCLVNADAQHPNINEKVIQALVAGSYQIPHPKSVWGYNLSYTDVSKALGTSFVAKPNLGKQGDAVKIIHNQSDFEDYLLQTESGDIICQEMIVDASEYRVYTIGGKGIASYKKVPAVGDFRGNLAVGGTSEPTEPDRQAELLEFSGKIAGFIGADIAGLDILYTTDGPIFLELNWQPTIVEDIPDVDLHQLILDYTQTKAHTFYKQI